MKTIEMEVGLMHHFGVRINVIVPNVSWGMGVGYECDLVKLTDANYATEIEIKVSKADLRADKKKRHTHNSKLFKYLYFAVPKDLVEYALKNIPEKAGLLSVSDRSSYYRVKEIKKPLLNKNHIKWDDRQRNYLCQLGTMRIVGLKQTIVGLMKDNEYVLRS